MARSAAVVLAAGLGTRFGQTPKLAALLGGKPILQHVLDALHEAEITPVVVVLGHAADDVRAAIEWRDEIHVVNRHPERGILRSVLLGLRRLDEMWSVPERTLIALGDQPRLSASQIDVLLGSPVDEERPFIVPRYADGSAANPVVLEASGRVLVEQFVIHTRKDTDRGLSQMFDKLPDAVRRVELPGTNADIDTPADLNRQVVADGYDALGAAYGAWSARVDDPARARFVADLVDRLADGASVLDLGCGPGEPTTRQLAERFDVTGVDISAAQLELARNNVPNAHFVQGDLSTVDFPKDSFDAVTALYSLTHVPRDEHAAVLRRIRRWLRPRGLLLATLSLADSPDWTGEWLGHQMFFSGWDAATNRELMTDAGFDILRDEEVEIAEPEGPARFLWVLASARLT